MARTNRSTFSNVAEKDLSNVFDISRFSFFQLMELLCKLDNVDVANILYSSPKDEKIRFTSTASLGFPVRDLIQLTNSKNGKRQLEISFLGLHGSESPLPSYYLENLAMEYAHKEEKLVDFINLFNHRLVLLFHQIWRKYRYYINFKTNGSDEFSQKMFSLVGLGHIPIRNKLSVNHSKMLAYAGILSSPARSPEIICNLVSHCFDLNNVTLKGWRFRYVSINEDEQNRLGSIKKEVGFPAKGRSCLGDNFTLGSKIPDRGGKFELRLNELTREEFLSFLPNGKNYMPLITFVSFILKDQFAWDLYLGLKKEQVSGMILGEGQNSLLGWTSFIGQPNDEPNVVISIRVINIMDKTATLLIIKIMNTAHVVSGKKIACIFNQNGGTIGCGENNLWVIQDNKGNLFDTHARVEWIDGEYCIQALGKAKLLINKAEFVSKSGFIRLKRDDLIEIGNLSARVHISAESEFNIDSLSLKPEDVIGHAQDYLQELIGENKYYKPSLKSQDNQFVDKNKNLDPLLILDKGNKITTVADDTSSTDVISHHTTKLIHKESRVSQHDYIDLPKLSSKNSDVDHNFLETSFVTISPLMREMDISIPLSNSQEANDFLSEIGKTLKVTVKGLLALQQAQSSLSDKHLRPIEDNPLRLNLDYVPTMDVLFGDQKSPVHLAAPAAVAESLNNLLIHNEANRIAITAALTAILEAFSPKILLTRFENYRRTNEMRETDDSWAWVMYDNYYKELTSKRQHGFEKLFWEVYSQAYDKALRDLQTK